MTFPLAGLVSYWSFDEAAGSTVRDAVGSNPGAWSGASGFQWTTGKIGPSAGYFNGTDNIVDFGAGSSLNPTAGLTVSCWLKPGPVQAAFAGPIAKGGAYWIEGDGAGSGTWQFGLKTGADNFCGLTGLPVGQWTHLVITWDGTTATTYKNGVSVATQPVSGSLAVTANHLLAGNRTGFSRFYAGAIDEVGIWNRALTPAEVTVLYAGGSGLPFSSATVGSNFNDAAINAVFDKVVSYGLGLGRFDSVNQHEPKSAPMSGITASIWVQSVRPARSSGQAMTSGVLLLNFRIYMNFVAQPFDMIDPAVTAATADIMGAFSGDFNFGGVAGVRAVDLLGMTGNALSAVAGYVEIDRKMFRVMTISIPIIINDMFAQVA